MEFTPEGRLFIRVIEDETADRGDALYAILWPVEMFEIVSSNVSIRWHAKISTVGDSIHAELAPKDWLRDGFWNDLVEPTDASEQARDDYQREIIALLTEEGVQRED